MTVWSRWALWLGPLLALATAGLCVASGQANDIAIVAFVAVVLFIRQRVCRPLADAMHVADTVASGDLTQDIQPGAKADEAEARKRSAHLRTNEANKTEQGNRASSAILFALAALG